MDQIWSEATDDIKKDSPPQQTKKTQKDNNSPHGSSWPGSRIEPPPPRLRSLRFDEFRFCHFIEEEAGFARKWSVLFSFLLLTRLLLWSPFQSCLFFQISSTPCDPPLQDSDVKLIKFKCINLKLHEASSCCVPTSHVECSIVKTQSIGVSPPIVKNYNHRMRRKVSRAIPTLLKACGNTLLCGSSLIFATNFWTNAVKICDEEKVQRVKLRLASVCGFGANHEIVWSKRFSRHQDRNQLVHSSTHIILGNRLLASILGIDTSTFLWVLRGT